MLHRMTSEPKQPGPAVEVAGLYAKTGLLRIGQDLL